jgi:hypothetical protein
MPPYPISCYRKDCGKLAEYKIAAQWSDGITKELKTYGLTCADCLAACFAASLRKQAACRLAPNETLDLPGIYALKRGIRDVELIRLPDLEEKLSRPALDPR